MSWKLSLFNTSRIQLLQYIERWKHRGSRKKNESVGMVIMITSEEVVILCTLWMNFDKTPKLVDKKSANAGYKAHWEH